MRIAICGLSSHTQLLFLPLAEHLENSGHSVRFYEPEYSGAVFLLKEHRSYHSASKRQSKSVTVEEVSGDLSYERTRIARGFSHSFPSFSNVMELEREAVRIASFYRTSFRNDEIHVVLMWSGFRILSAMAKTAARGLNIPCVHIEKGMFPKSLQVDLHGVNGANSQRTRLSHHGDSPDADLDRFKRRLEEEWMLDQPLKGVNPLFKLKYFWKEKRFVEFGTRAVRRYVFRSTSFKIPTRIRLSDPIGLVRETVSPP